MVVITNEREVFLVMRCSKYTIIQVVIPFLPINNNNIDKKDKENLYKVSKCLFIRYFKFPIIIIYFAHSLLPR